MSISQIILNGKEFSNLSGLYFNIPLIISSLIAGLLTERFSRRLIISTSTIGIAACVVGMGFSNTYWLIVVMRIIQGLFLGLMYPTIIGLVVDYFPAYRTSTAVGLVSVGSQLGIAMNFETTNIITAFGWRVTYGAVGFFFVGIGIAMFLLIKDPMRG